MPIEVTAFACKFRCGRRVTTHRDDIWKHEKTCFLNPEVKACKSCRHNELVPYEHDTGDGGYFQCNLDKIPDGKKCVTNCEWWKASNNSSGTSKR